MERHKIEIQVAPSGFDSKILMDGQELKNVFGVSARVAADGLSEIRLDLVCMPIGVSAEFEAPAGSFEIVSGMLVMKPEPDRVRRLLTSITCRLRALFPVEQH